MNIQLPKPGKYVLAVSGGLDSVCLLDILAKTQSYDLIVAHFDHGIRPDSGLDEHFVGELAKMYGLDYVQAFGNLGATASEAAARKARYVFLGETVNANRARALITAHHQGDRLETAIINLIRGTGRRGLSSLRETGAIKRPFLKVTKDELRQYAMRQHLSWREDSTNADTRYLRNYIRHHIVTRLSERQINELLELIDRQELLNKRLDRVLAGLVTQHQQKLSIRLFNVMPYSVSKELMAAWLRANRLLNFDRKTIERLTVAAKTKRPGTKINIYGDATMTVHKGFLALSTSER